MEEENLSGGKLTAKTNRERYGKDFYIKIGQKGGKRRVPKGFALMSKEKHREVSIKGGSVKKDKNE